MAHRWILKVECKSIYVVKIEIMNINHSKEILKELDSNLKRLLDVFEIDDLIPEKNYFKSLTRSIIYQQLSGASAKAIHNKFISIYGNDIYPTPKQVLRTQLETLHSIGLSRFKAQYIHNIADAFIKDPVRYETLDQKKDEDIIHILTEIKGIGLWTAQMFLMFTLNRPDVFPATDLALQKGFQFYFDLDQLPKVNEMIERSQKWRPHRTTVSLFFWRILEGPFEW
mgnify:CR=1 FL=1